MRRTSLPTTIELEKDIRQLVVLISEQMKKSTLSEASNSWLKGVLNIMDSKVMVNSNVDDLLWFHAHGLGNCERVIDLGCGGGYLSLLLSRLVKHVSGYEYIGKWVGQQYGEDQYREAFSFAHRCVQQLAGNVDFGLYESFPLNLKDESVDAVVLYAVIEHLGPTVESSFFAEVRRVLKPNGLLFIAKLPRKLSYQEHIAKWLKLGSHERLYTRKMTKSVLNQYGFDVTHLEKTGLFFNHPNSVVNPMFRLTSVCENIINKYCPPLKLFAHDYRLVAIKK